MANGSNNRYLLHLYHAYRKVMRNKSRSVTNFEMYFAEEGVNVITKLLPKITNCISVRGYNHICVTLGLMKSIKKKVIPGKEEHRT